MQGSFLTPKKIIILVVAVLAIAAFFIFDLKRFLSLEYLKNSHESLLATYEANKALMIGGFFGIYVAMAALSLPGATILTLGAGAIFGLWLGLLLVSFASTLGATLAFLLSRFLFRDAVASKFSKQFERVEKGVEKDGAFFLLTMRLIPAIPFFVVNLLMGLTSMRTITYALVSQLGMLPGTAVYVNAGSELSKIESTSDILSPQLIGAFVLLGVFPIIAKKVIEFVRKKKNEA